MDLQLKDKKVLVTGSAKGIGLATAEAFLREGAHVWINGRTEESVRAALSGLKEKYPDARVQAIVADVGTEAGIEAITNKIPELDVLVNNAGMFRPEEFAKISRESWIQFYEVNVLSGARLTQFYLPKMIEKNWGRVVFISSESALNIPVEMVHYGMTKTAQLAVSRGAAEVCKGSRVTVNSVLPGPTYSEGVQDFVKKLGITEKQFFTEARPSSIAQRFAKTEEVADLVVFVSSARAAMINGAALRVDGGTAKIVI
jgi:NAD(P)-dependent dehydrogenase (short-subunit alcohol dehydrogenase family)